MSLLLVNKRDERPGGNAPGEVESNWVFLDEIREIGKLQGYHELANKGRSKGVRLVLGFQSIEGMKTEHGDHAADEIANLCAHRTFLHTTSVNTRKWEAEQVGTVVVDETVFNFSNTVSKGGWSNTVSHQTNRVTRQALEASDFDQNIKIATPENGLIALNFIPYIGTYVSWVPWTWVLKNVPFPPRESFSDEQRPGDHQKLEDWGPADFSRLNLPPTIVEGDEPLEKGSRTEGEGKEKKEGAKKSKNKNFGKTSRNEFNKDR
jgi:hypothetical protein